MTTRKIGFKRVRKVKLLRKLAPKYEFCVSPFEEGDDDETNDGVNEVEKCEDDNLSEDENDDFDDNDDDEDDGQDAEDENDDQENDDENDDFETAGNLVTSLEELEEKAQQREEMRRRKEEKEKQKQIKQNNPPKQSKGRKSFLQWKAKIKDNETATKEEYAVAKHVRFNCPTMDAKFVPMQNMVKCFYGNKAIDCLLDSKWAKTDKGDIHFTDRKSCAAFMEKLMMKGLLHRASKFEKSKKDRDKKKRKKEEDSAVDEEKKEKKDKKKLKEKEKESKEGKEASKEEGSEKEKEEKKSEEKEKKKKEKKERKLKLDMAEEQYFIDGEEIYVWIYDPVPFKTFFIGLLMVIGAIALCLFPLWPDWMRVAVYYISLVGASFVGLILVLVVIRGILFCAIWLVTMGKLHFWFLPNLTEDVGFFDSFKPVYTYKFYRAEDVEKEKQEQEKKKNKKEEKRKKKELEEIEYDKEEEQGFEVVDRSEVEGSQDDELDTQGEDTQMEGGEEEEDNEGESEEGEEEEGTEEGSEEQEEEGDKEGETKKTK